MSCCGSNLQGNELEDAILSGTGRGRAPIYAQWEITCRCNLKCVMCYTDCFNTPDHIKQELSTDEIIRIMNEMKEEGVLELTLTGGEPMARPDFKEIYIHAIESGFLTTVFTNGTYIDEKWIDIFNQYTPTMIEISYLGHSKATFDQMTAIEGSFERVNRGIELVLENELPLTIKATATNLNHQEILDIKRWARAKNVYFRLGTIVRSLANGDESSKSFQAEENFLAEMIAADEELSRDEQKLNAALAEDTSGCHSGIKRFHLDAYGKMQLCSDNRSKGYDLRKGSLREGFYEHLPHFPCPLKK